MSVPGQIKKLVYYTHIRFVHRYCLFIILICYILYYYSIETNKLATHDIDLLSQSSCECNSETTIPREDIIQEEEPINMPPPPIPTNTTATRKYVWRIDLSKTEQHWFGWFKGLSTAFLNVPAPKVLLLAGVDRLDRELTVGQMQGILLLVSNFIFNIYILC